MGKLMYSCAEASRRSSRAMEQPLTASERVLLGLHLMVCKRCSSFARQIDFLRRASRELPEALDQDTIQ